MSLSSINLILFIKLKTSYEVGRFLLKSCSLLKVSKIIVTILIIFFFKKVYFITLCRLAKQDYVSITVSHFAQLFISFAVKKFVLLHFLKSGLPLCSLFHANFGSSTSFFHISGVIFFIFVV
jgi:hypothetical protein